MAAFVQTANSGTPSGSTTSKTATFASAQSAGNLNVVVISFGNASATSISNVISSVTDSKGNTYAAANAFLSCQSVTGSDALGQIIYCAPGIAAATAGSNVVTVNLSLARDFFTVVLLEYSGLATSSPVDVTAGTKADSPSAATASTGSLTTTATGEALVSAFAFFDGPATTTNLTAGFTQRAKFYTQLEADQLGVATGSYSCSCASGGTSGWIAQMVALKVAGVVTLHFPMVIADTTSVTALGFHIGQRFPLTITDTTVVSLSFHLAGGTALHFPLTVIDTSQVLALGFHATQHFALAVIDTTLVTSLGFEIVVKRFPLLIADTSFVLALGFENDHYRPPVPVAPLTVAPYAGQVQPEWINVNADIAGRESQWEDGPLLVPPYAGMFQEGGAEALPPRISATDLWAAMQEFPL